MPELPDVEVMKRRVERQAIGRQVASVEVDPQAVLSRISPRELETLLPGLRLVAARRHGKFLFVELANGAAPEAAAPASRWLAFHFGMTGRLLTVDPEGPQPDHSRVTFRFTDGTSLIFDCPRRFGYLEAITAPAELIADRGLGPDVLTLDLAAFQQLAAGWSGSIKSLLLNQGKLAGVGNVYSDEALFQAAIHPRRPAADLTAGEVEELHRTLGRVLATAVEHDGDRSALPDGFLLPHREEGATCPRCDGLILRGKVSGRSAFWCERHQGI